MLICFNGIDGAGKTTQAQRLVEHLNRCGYPAEYVWSGGRTLLSRPFTHLAKRILDGSQHAAAVEAVATSLARSPYLANTRRLLGWGPLRSLWLYFSLYEHAAKIRLTVLPRLAQGKVVICDRYLYDSIVTVALLAGLEPDALPALLKLPPGCHVPQPACWFFLDLPAERAASRKAELRDVPLLQQRIALYREMAAALDMYRINASAPPDDVAMQIFDRVMLFLAPAGPASTRPARAAQEPQPTE